jgi:hypothetical protein
MEIKPVRVFKKDTGKSISSDNNSEIKLVRVSKNGADKSDDDDSGIKLVRVSKDKSSDIKKKSTTVSPSEQNQEDVSLGTSTMEVKKPLVSSGSVGKRKSALDTFDEIGKVFEPYSAESKYKQRQKELKKDINKAEIKKDLSEQEMADALGWDKEDIKKATAGTGASKLTPAMAKPNVVTPKGEGFSDKSQRNAVKAYQDLGKNANQEKIQERKKYYDVVDNQKYLKDQGYDVDINGKSDDEKTLRAIKKDQAKSKVIEQEAIKAADVDNKIDSIINEDLLKNEEEEAVVKLRKNFSKDGFYFEESGLGDNIIVEFRPDGITASKRIEIPFDNSNLFGANSSSAKELNTFMKQAYMTKSERNELNNADDLGKVIKLMASNPYKYGEELIDEDLKENFLENRNRQINQERKSLQLEYKDLESKINDYNSNPDPVEKKYIDNKMHELSLKEYKLNERDHDVRDIEKNYSKATAIYYKGKEEKGNLIGNIASGFASGITNIQKTALEEVADVLPSILGAENVFNPVQYQQMKDEGMSDDDIMDYASKELKRGVIQNIKDGIIDVGSLGTTTKEYKTSEDRGVLENVGNFLAESIGTSLSGGGSPGLTRLAFFTQSYNGMKDQMVGEEFDGLSEGEKTLIAVPYGLVVGALEKFGYDASLGFSKSGIFNKAINGILRKTLTELPKDATVETLKRTINAEVSNLVKSGAIKIATGSITEGAVEGMQSLTETSTKNIVNQLYDKDLFKGVPDLTTKKGVMEALDMAKTDAAYGVLGGLIMSGASISNQTYKQAKFNETSDYNFDLFYNSMMDDKLRKSIEYNTKLKVKNGEITKEEALEEIESIRKNTGVLKTIPTELSNRDKKESFNLILEKQKLETEIEGKNDNLVAPKKARIEEINNELKTIGENATKESNKQENGTEGDIVQREGVNVGQQEDGQGEGSQRETAQPSTDTSDSNISSQEEKDYTPEDKSRLDEINIILSKDMNAATDEDIESMILARKEKTEIENKYGLNDAELKHGTPHDFNKFETEKIGTGEGAQAFGYGLYFTENSKIAKGYADKLSKDKSGIIYTVKIKNGKTNNWLEWREPIDASQAVELSKVLKSKKEKYNEYLNSIDDEKSHTGAAENLFEDNVELDDYRPISNASLYNDLSDAFGQNEASKIMSEAGIDGVKYKTRQGKGSDFNYVVFNPKTITITKKEATDNTTKAQQPVTETIVEEGPTFDDVKSLDTKDATNLKKALDFITGIEESLDKFGKGTLGINLAVPVAKAVIKTVKTLLQAGVSLEQAIKQAATDNNVTEKDVNDTIFSLSDAQQRAARERITGEKQAKPKQTTASQSAKEISKRKSTKVTVDEMAALKDQIKLEAKAAKEKGKQIKDILKDISQITKELVKKGTITLKQQSTIQNKLASVNFDSQASIEKYVDYIDRKFNKANLSYKVNEGNKTRKAIKKKTNNAPGHFVPVAKNFSSINPNMVEDIDEYNRIAELVLGSVTKARTIGEKLISAEEANINEVSAYTEKALERQEKINNDRLIQRYADINDLTFDEANQISIEKIKEGLDNATFKEKFSPEEARQNILEEIENQKENIDEDSDDRIKKISKFNLELLDNKRLLEIIDAFDSYFANDAITNLDKIIGEYEGIEALNNFKSPSRKLNFAFIKPLGRRKDRNLTNLNMIIEKIFPGQSNANKFKEASSLNDLINGSNKAENERNKKEDQYLNKYKKIKDFFSAENIFERGVIATLNRQLSDGDNDTYFKDRVRILLNSVNEMKKSVDPAVKRSAAIYEKVYEKLGLNDENVSIESINKNAESFNKEAVNDIIDMFGEIYPDLYELNLSMYNTQLSKDINYTPDNYRNTENTDKFDESLLASGFNQFNNNNNVKLDKNKAGVLMDTSRPSNVTEGSYLDLNFESNVFRSYGLALNDLYTAKAIAKADAFMNSDKNKFNELFNNSADANLVRNAFKDYVNSKKGKSEFIDADEKTVNKFVDTIGAFSSARALAGVGQAITQFSTAMSNTIIQAGEHIRFGDLTDTDFWEKISDAGLPISNVSADALTNLRKVNTKMKRAITKGTAIGRTSDVTLKSLLGVNKFMLKWTLQKPDRAARLVTFATFYRKYMSDNNIVDNGEINKDAANYAQSMTDRTMDVTDTDLRGKLFTTETGAANYIKNVLFPFASFRLNQRARLTVDLKNAFAKSTNINDGDRSIAIRSLIGTSVEIATYNFIRYNISKALIYAAFSALGYDDDEIDEMNDKLIINIKKSIVSNAITDVLSPIPEADQYILELSNKILKFTKLSDPSEKQINDFIDNINNIRQANNDPTLTEDEKSDKIKKFKEDKQFQLYIDDEKNLGKYGIQMERLSELVDLAKTYATGEYKDEYQGRVTDKILTDKGRESLKYAVIAKAAGATIGLRELNMFSDKTLKIVKDKEGLTDTRKEKYDVIKEKYKNIDAYKKSLIESSMKVDKIMEQIDYIESTGGFTKSQSREYAKLRSEMPVQYHMIDKIRSGKTAEEIKKTPY